MIKLTNARTGSYIWINPDKVVDLGETALSGQTATFITTVNSKENDEFNNLVLESPEEVTRKILEYKLAMVRYAACQNEFKYDIGYAERTEIERLAGLEEAGHDQ